MIKILTITIALLLALATMGLKAQTLCRSQAVEDIDSLLYTISEVHPNMYSNTSQQAINDQVIKLKDNMADSIAILDLYQVLAPIVAQIGDAHTCMVLPHEEIMIKAGKYIPVFPSIDNNTGRMYVKASVANTVAYDSEILSINGVSASDMVNKMKTFVSGEREFFRLTMIDNNIMDLFHLLYAASEYTIVYCESGSNQKRTVTLQAVDGERLNSDLVLSPKILKLMEEHSGEAPYTFRILKDKPIAIMNFDACQDEKGMEVFADSMFSTLREKDIKDLVIDIRYNGGGNSRVGDVLLKHISPEPFAQFGKTYIRVTQTTQSLSGKRYEETGEFCYPEDILKRKKALSPSKRFNGNVYLLTSHTTFSSASSFAWAFKTFHCGTVVGEETGGMSVHYGDVLTYTMPHSHLSCNISHKRFWQPGADENDIHGVIPDIICPQEEALNTTLQMIKK